MIGFPLATLGVSFAIIRIFMTLKQALNPRRDVDLLEFSSIVTATFYLPALPVGPVFSGLELRKDRMPLTGVTISRNLRLIFAGLMLVSLFGPALESRIEQFGSNPVLAWTLIPFLLFLQLFFAFWGQSLIAENFAPLFGHRLPINFIEPWKARDIRDFWARWHRSMAKFVTTYIFFPMQRNGISVWFSTVSAFVFMGLWHNISIGYLIWGFAHGNLLAFWPKNDEAPSPLKGVAIRVFTVVVVIGLSYVANHVNWMALLT